MSKSNPIEVLKFIAETDATGGVDPQSAVEAMRAAGAFITTCRRKAGEALPAVEELTRQRDELLEANAGLLEDLAWIASGGHYLGACIARAQAAIAASSPAEKEAPDAADGCGHCGGKLSDDNSCSRCA